MSPADVAALPAASSKTARTLPHPLSPAEQSVIDRAGDLCGAYGIDALNAILNADGDQPADYRGIESSVYANALGLAQYLMRELLLMIEYGR